jgi:hypothetical protein
MSQNRPLNDAINGCVRDAMRKATSNTVGVWIAMQGIASSFPPSWWKKKFPRCWFCNNNLNVEGSRPF